MCDDDIHQGLMMDPAVSRRTFGLMAVAASGAASAAYAQAGNVIEKDVDIKTADGTADAALFYPAGKGPWPAVLVWTDIMGLRPAFREMGRRMASQGYVVLVPNPFYRAKKAPVIDGAFDFNKPEDRAKVFAFRGSMTNDEGDARSYLAYLDTLPQTDKKKKIGAQGYCMGGPLVFKTAAVAPGRVGAVGSFHGGGLVTKDDKSPHLLVGKTNAQYVVAVAQNDDMTQPEAKDVLKKTFADLKKTATVEVYPANHGWCVRDGATYNEAAAEKAWAELSKMYKTALV